MSDDIIKVNNVSMCFKMSSEKVDSLKDYIIKNIKRQIVYEELWALKNVSFSIKRGGSLGLIGLNGSGKSTMLKIIAGVMKPTRGTVEVKGNIAPLIELSGGFDMNLTARENVYLNGALLGHTREEMNLFYDDIVEFSELNKFMDIPVKNFSSGMIARLGFSIATVGSPDILIVDEALSVGDFRFRDKCLNRISKMREKNTTVLYVSHDNKSVEETCETILWLNKGEVVKYGDSKEVCEEYRKLYNEK